MTGRALLVFVSARTPAATAALLLLGALLASCGEAEEEVGPDTQPSATVPPSSSASPVPLTATPVATAPTSDWQGYSNPAVGLAFDYPPGLTASEEAVEVPGKDGAAALVHTVITIATPTGTPGAAIAIAPNPSGLGLKEWIAANPGWTSEPTETSVAGRPALVFPLNAMGEAQPVIYFRYSGYVVGVRRIPSNIQSDGLIPVVSESEFQRLLTSIRLSG